MRAWFALSSDTAGSRAVSRDLSVLFCARQTSRDVKHPCVLISWVYESNGEKRQLCLFAVVICVSMTDGEF